MVATHRLPAAPPRPDTEQGFGHVDDAYAWAHRSGRPFPTARRDLPAGQPDDEHIGIVESIDADGTVHTIERNSRERTYRTYGHDGGGAIRYARLG